MKRSGLLRIADDLAKVPAEIACQILDDVRIWDVLCLVCVDNPNVNRSIRAHIWYGKIFQADEDVSKVRDVTLVYRDFTRQMRIASAPYDSILARSARYTSIGGNGLQGPVFSHTIVNYMTARVLLVLDGMEPWQRAVLGLPGPTWSFESLQVRWQKIQEAQAALNQKKHSQLMRAADLLEANPDLLKLAADPSQTRRANTGHIVTRMRQVAAKLSRSHVLPRRVRKSGAYYFRYAFFPVAPFDQCIQSVLERLVEKRGAIDLRLPSSTLSPELGENAGAHHLQTFLNGLPQIYTELYLSGEPPGSSSDGQRRRVESALVSELRLSAEDPASKTEEEGRRKNHSPSGQVTRIARHGDPYDLEAHSVSSQADIEGLGVYTPLWADRLWCSGVSSDCGGWWPQDGREIEWLEAFVRVYRTLHGGEIKLKA